MFLTDLPQGLAPLQDIEHPINLVPEDHLPNKPAYNTGGNEVICDVKTDHVSTKTD